MHYFFLLLAEAFVFAAMWHNESLRSESGKPDPAVLFLPQERYFTKAGAVSKNDRRKGPGAK